MAINIIKIKDIAVYIAVYSWGGNLAVGLIIAKTGDKDVDIATQKDKILIILAVAVITAKIDKLLAKNIIKKKIIKIKISKIIYFNLI